MSVTYKWLLSNKIAVTKNACAIHPNCTWSPIKLNRDEETEKEDWLSERAYVIQGMQYYTITVTYMVFHSGAVESFNTLHVYFIHLTSVALQFLLYSNFYDNITCGHALLERDSDNET
jgi:hypothetical protein